MSFLSRIEDFESDRQFDIIIMLSLIEHVSDPAMILSQMTKLLTPDGRLIIKTPNTDTLDRRLFMKYYWGGLHSPRHWILFNEQNLTQLAQRCGLSVDKFWYTQGAPQWTTSILGSLLIKGKISFPNNKMYNHWPVVPLQILTAVFDLLRGHFTKTAQFFFVLRRRE